MTEDQIAWKAKSVGIKAYLSDKQYQAQTPTMKSFYEPVLFWRTMDSAPKDGTEVLIRDELYGKPWHYTAIWNSFEWYHGLGVGFPDPKPKFWMPIPTITP